MHCNKDPSLHSMLKQIFFFLFFFLSPHVQCQLDYGFYDDTCPKVAKIVRYGVWSAVYNDTRIAASLLRLHFHDCFVNGCDASLLLDETSTMKSEKNANPNRNSARGFEVIDEIKAKVEKVCPGTVSCADILTLAAREAVSIVGGPSWAVALGRRDGTTANQDGANKEIPAPNESLQNITAKFTAKGLSFKDMVVLSGAHTIGFAQCFTFKSRLSDFQGSGKPDPTLDSSLLQNLQTLCPTGDASNNNLAPLDPVTKDIFDNLYFKNLVNSSGLLQSDQALMGDSDAAALVNRYSSYQYLFFKDFGTSMEKMGTIGIIDGKDGQIRKNCRVVN